MLPVPESESYDRDQYHFIKQDKSLLILRMQQIEADSATLQQQLFSRLKASSSTQAKPSLQQVDRSLLLFSRHVTSEKSVRGT
jgi:hypothetical protein